MTSILGAASDPGSPHKRKRPEDHNGNKRSKKRRHRPKETEKPNINGDDFTEEPEKQDYETELPVLTNGHAESSLQLVEAVPQNGVQRMSTAPWVVSAPMGGRMVDVDPIFSLDEKYAP